MTRQLYNDKISEEMKEANYLSVTADETSDLNIF